MSRDVRGEKDVAIKVEEHEMNVVTTNQTNNRSQGSTSPAAKDDDCMKEMHAHITKLLTFLILIILGIIVATLKQQFSLRSDLDEGQSTTTEHIKRLDKFDSNVGGKIESILSGFFGYSGTGIHPSKHLEKMRSRLATLNKTLIIQNGWEISREQHMYYHLFSNEVGFSLAQDMCRDWSGTLAARILRNNYTVGLIPDSPTWVGAKRINNEWFWEDGNPHNNTVQITTKELEDNDNEDYYCGFIGGKMSGQLIVNATTCNSTMPFICEVKLNFDIS